MNRRRRIYEGKAKILYEGPEPGTLVQYFKDDATAGNGAKHEVIDGKGVIRFKYVGALTDDVVASQLLPAIKAAGG